MPVNPANPQCTPGGTHVFVHSDPLPPHRIDHQPGTPTHQTTPSVGSRCQCGAMTWTTDGAKPS